MSWKAFIYVLSCFMVIFMQSVPATAEKKTIKTFAIMTPEQGTDYGWNQQGIVAAQKVAKSMGLKVVVAQGLGYGDIRSNIRELAADGVDLILAHAGGYNTAGAEIAKETKIPVAIVDQPKLAQEKLIADYTASGHEAAFLAGYLAAKMTRSNIIGIVTSGEPPTWNAHSHAFIKGAQKHNPSIKIHYAVIGPAAYADVTGAKRVTEAVIATGVDVILGQGNGSSFGMLQAVESNKANDGGKIWFIDVIGDKSPIDKGHLLSAVVWDFVPIFTKIIHDLQNGTFGKNLYELNLKDKSTYLLKSPYIPENIWNEVMALHNDIVNGKIMVEKTYEVAPVHSLVQNIQ